MGELSRGKRFVFIGGSPRSGTTLVQNILDSHPVICGGPEFHHLPDIMNLRKALRDSIAKGWIDLICSYEDVDKYIAELIENLLLPLADRSGSVLLSEKTPSNVLVFRDLMEVFPQARFIHLVRDPRAVIASLLKVGERAKQEGWRNPAWTYEVPAAIAHVRKNLEAGFSSAAAAPDRVLTIVYERLVTDPENETKTICNFLNIEWHASLLHPAKKSHSGEKAIVNRVWYDKETFNRDPVTSEISKWKSQLTPLQKFMINRGFRDVTELDGYGYDFSDDASSPISPFSRLAYTIRNNRMISWMGRRVSSVTRHLCSR